MHFSSICILLNYITISLTSKVIWLPSTSFNLPINFKDGKIPCSKQNVIFPETLSGSIRIESGTSVGGFILPVEGELSLADGVIEFGPIEDVNCTSDRNSYFTEKSVSHWSQPDVWSSIKFNEATPDAERVPCFDDTVEFPTNTDFTVVLPDETQRVLGLKLNGVSYDTNGFKDYIIHSDESQQFILNENEETGIEVVADYCRSPAGCMCQRNVLEIDCSAKFCPLPSCVDPIQPIGHCCKICGGVISFQIDRSFDMTLFKEKIEKILDSYGKNSLIYHVGRIASNKVQLIVIDKDEYTGTSAEVVNDIGYNMDAHLVPNLLISGSPINKAGVGAKVVSIFFTVIIVMGAIYIYYYKLPEIRLPVIGRSQPTLFSRFDRRTESVVSLARRDSIASMGPSVSTAFRNPLYDSKRSNTAEESSMEE